jgi:hypothetical protein
VAFPIIQSIHRLESKIMMTMRMMVDVYQVWPLGRTNDLMSPSPRARRLITRNVTTTEITTSPISPMTTPTIFKTLVALDDGVMGCGVNEQVGVTGIGEFDAARDRLGVARGDREAGAVGNGVGSAKPVTRTVPLHSD